MPANGIAGVVLLKFFRKNVYNESMINPDAKLNQKMFDEGAEQRPTRDGFGEGLVMAGEENSNVIALSPTSRSPRASRRSRKNFPGGFLRWAWPSRTWRRSPPDSA